MLVGPLWITHLVNVGLFSGQLLTYGIRPRDLDGLQGILWAPFLHGNYGHLISNTIPLVTLGWLIMLQEIRDIWVVTSISALVSGTGTWLIGGLFASGFRAEEVHIGASGVVFGYLGYLLLRGFFERSGTAITLSILVFAMYGGLIWGVLPIQQGISWEGHLFGLIGGGLAARSLARRSRYR